MNRNSLKVMSMKWYIASWVVMIFCMLSCHKRTLESDYLVFGKYCGECVGECIVIYKLQDGNLYKMIRPDYMYSKEGDYKYKQLTDENYQLVKDLYDEFPSELWKMNEGNIGIPDAYDQCGYVISLSKDGVTKVWYIDTNEKAIPAFLHDYMDKIENSIQILK